MDFPISKIIDFQLITSYDYGAPIAENGDITPIYSAIRSFVQNLSDWEYPPGDVPKNNPSKAYGQVNLQRIGSGLIPALTSIQETCQSSAQPMTFEQINHPYGFVLYSTTLIKVGTKLVTPGISDMGYVFVNNNYQVKGLFQDRSQDFSLEEAHFGREKIIRGSKGIFFEGFPKNRKREVMVFKKCDFRYNR